MVLFEACFYFLVWQSSPLDRSKGGSALRSGAFRSSKRRSKRSKEHKEQKLSPQKNKKKFIKKKVLSLAASFVDVSTYRPMESYGRIRIRNPLSLSFEPLKVSLASVYPSQALLQSWSSVTVDDLKVATWRDSKRLVSWFRLEVLSFRLMFGSRITNWKLMDTMDMPSFMSFMICIMMFLNMWLWGFGHIQCMGQSFLLKSCKGNSFVTVTWNEAKGWDAKFSSLRLARC